MNRYKFRIIRNSLKQPGMFAIFFLYILLAFSNVAGAETVASTKLTALIDEALANNPEIKAVQAELKSAKLRVPQSYALPDPQAGYSEMGPMLETMLGPQEEVYEFEQMIPFPGKLLEKRKIAKAEAQSAQARLESTERDVIYNIAQTYYDLYAAQKSLQASEEIHVFLTNFQSAAQSIYASNKGTQKDVNKAQIESSAVLQKVYSLRQQKESLLGMLSSLLDREVTEDELKPMPELAIPADSLELDELIAQTQKNRPSIKEAVSMVSRDKHADRLSKYEYAPDITVGFQYFQIGDGGTNDPDDGEDAWMIPIKFTIPLWQNRIIPAVIEAKENLKASESRLKSVENSSNYEVKNAFYKFTSSKDIADLYAKVLLPQVKLSLDSDMASYESGSGDLLSLIDSERTYLDTQIAYYEALAEVLKNRAMLERVVGIDLSAQGGLE